MPLSTSGVGTAEQNTASVRPAGGTLFLIDADGNDVTYLATDAGYYFVNNDHLGFNAHDGYSGTAPAVDYTIANAAMQSSTSTYTVTVTKPAPPIATPMSSTGGEGHYYQYADTSGISTNPEVFLISGTAQVASLYVTGKGTYHADGGDGVSLSFQADSCFVGAVPAVTYRLVDQYAQHDDSTYTAHVTNPSPPTVNPLSSTGSGPATQTVTAPQPDCAGGSTTLLNASGQPVTVLTRSDGTYSVRPATGVITFVPAPGYSGVGAAVRYRVTDAQGQHSDSSYTTTVAAPSPPTASALTSTGTGPAAQHVTAALPIGGHAMLLDGTNPVTSVTIAGQGMYAVNTTSGVITFTPAAHFLGTATPVSYTVTDSYQQSATSTYGATVTEPAAPTPAALTSTGAGTAVQSRTVSTPPAGTVTLLDGLTPVTTLTVAGQGTYALDPATGVIRFTPVNGYLGTATSAMYRVTDSYGQTGSATYTPTVTIPARPAAAPLRSTGIVGSTQQQTVTIPAGGAVTLVNGTPTVTNAGQGTYALNPATGVITFTPLAGYSGRPTPVTYRVNDAYGQSVESTYAPTVTAAPTTTTPTTPTTVPTTTTAATVTTTPTASATPGAAATLPYTGSNVGQLAQIALLLLVVGVALTASTYFRRRPRSHEHR